MTQGRRNYTAEYREEAVWLVLDSGRSVAAVALVPGGALVAGVPGQHRPATQFLTGWSRDFVTVLAP